MTFFFIVSDAWKNSYATRFFTVDIEIAIFFSSAFMLASLGPDYCDSQLSSKNYCFYTAKYY